MRFRHEMTSAKWDETLSQWRVSFKTDRAQVEDTADVLISCVGPLNLWKWPDLEVSPLPN